MPCSAKPGIFDFWRKKKNNNESFYCMLASLRTPPEPESQSGRVCERLVPPEPLFVHDTN